MGSRYSNFLTIGLIVGIVVIVIGICVGCFFMVRNDNINNDGEDAVEQFQNEKVGRENEEENNTTDNGEVIQPDLPLENIAPVLTDTNIIAGNTSSNNEKKVSMYKGFPMVGTIEIPSINVKSPVLKDASKNSMQVAVGIYDGPGLNEIGNTTIAGHNYKDGRFFSDIKKIKEGDLVYITDVAGQKIAYTVYKAPYITNREDVSYLERDTGGKREISLIGCTDDVQNIYVVWAKEQ